MYSVIIPSLGRFEYLNELLISILNQNVLPNEILVLLDENLHCRSGSKNLVQNELIRIMYCDGINLAEKRNYGAKIARSDLIIFSDDDDIWNVERAERIIPELDQFAVCCHNYDKFGAQSSFNVSKLGCQDRQIGVGELFYGTNIFGGGSSIATHRAVVRLIPFNRKFKYCEDYDWWVRIIVAGLSIKYLGQSLVSYRTHSSNMTSSILKIQFFCIKVAQHLFIQALAQFAIAAIITIRFFFALVKIPFTYRR